MADARRDAQVSSVKASFFVYWQLFSVLAGALAIFSNILIGLDFEYNHKWFLSISLSLLLIWLAMRKFHVHWVHRAGVYVSGFLMIPGAWLSSSGLESPAIMWSLVGFVAINYLLQGSERIVANLAYLAVLMWLIWIGYQMPWIYSSYASAEQQMQDWLFNLPLLVGFLVFSLIHFERAHEKQRQANLRKADQLAALSATDPLTGLYNRQRLHAVLRDSLAHYRRSGSPSSVLFIDVDAFKPYNDKYGHSQGDACLRQIADCLRESVQRSDTDFAFRFGGEEFLLVLQHTDLAGAETVANRLKERVRTLDIAHAHSEVAPRITLSIGIAVTRPSDRTPDDLISRADAAQYEAKDQGRDRIIAAA